MAYQGSMKLKGATTSAGSAITAVILAAHFVREYKLKRLLTL